MKNSIFEYNDYRLYLRQIFRQRGRGELKKLAEYLKISSTVVSQVFSESKDFTIEQAQQIGTYLALPNLETDYFIILVQIERAANQDLKNYFREKRESLKKESLKISRRVLAKYNLTEADKATFYSSKIYSAVHLYTSIGNGVTVDQVMNRFSLTRERAGETLQFLTKIGLCKFTGSSFQIAQFSTHASKGSPFLLKHHSNWRIEAIQKSETLRDEELMFTANISLSRKDFQKIRELLAVAIQDVSKQIADSDAEDVANLNIDLFWL